MWYLVEFLKLWQSLLGLYKEWKVELWGTPQERLVNDGRILNGDFRRAKSKVRWKAMKKSAMETNLVLKVMKDGRFKDGMIDSIKAAEE